MRPALRDLATVRTGRRRIRRHRLTVRSGSCFLVRDRVPFRGRRPLPGPGPAIWSRRRPLVIDGVAVPGPGVLARHGLPVRAGGRPLAGDRIPVLRPGGVPGRLLPLLAGDRRLADDGVPIVDPGVVAGGRPAPGTCDRRVARERVSAAGRGRAARRGATPRAGQRRFLPDRVPVPGDRRIPGRRLAVRSGDRRVHLGLLLLVVLSRRLTRGLTVGRWCVVGPGRGRQDDHRQREHARDDSDPLHPSLLWVSIFNLGSDEIRIQPSGPNGRAGCEIATVTVAFRWPSAPTDGIEIGRRLSMAAPHPEDRIPTLVLAAATLMTAFLAPPQGLAGGNCAGTSTGRVPVIDLPPA